MCKHKSFLKWLGNKGLVSDTINNLLPSGDRLIEPFLGSGAIFLNSDYDNYLLSDINPDLINLYNIVKNNPVDFIAESKKLFLLEDANTPEFYYDIRDKFRVSDDLMFKSIAFLYMNRHGFRGLCRYNLSGEFNVPYGHYKQVYFPEEELEYFAEKAKKATFVCGSFVGIMNCAVKGTTIYADPPYVKISDTSNFTSYAGNTFGIADQETLALEAEKAVKRGVNVVISNSDTSLCRSLYHKANIKELKVKRSIGHGKKSSEQASELLACYFTDQ